MSIVLDGTANTVTPLNGALGATTPSTVAATTVVASSTIKGATTISVGNATPSASGAGITFPATQSASTDANTLDDYEEGTWTPSLGGTATYNNQDGKYTKIGNTVYFQGHLNVNTIGTGSASRVSGFPFPCIGTLDGAATITYFVGLAVNVIQPVLNVNAGGQSNADVYSRTTAGNAATIVNIFGNAARIYFTGFYQTT